MNDRALPTYALPIDYPRYIWIAVLVRWGVLVVWFYLQNTRITETDWIFWTNNGFAAGLAVINAYVTWRLSTGRAVTRRHALALSILDLVLITAGIFVASGFDNQYFVLYYPALLAMAIVFPSRRLSFGVVGAVMVVYTVLSVTLEPTASYADRDEKVLVIRLATMLAVVAAANLMHRVERERRREAVEAERAQAERNLELQRKAQEAELAAQQERDRVAREIHDGVAQSVYALSLNLETAAELADREEGPLRQRLGNLVTLSTQTLLEIRQYIFDIKPLLSGESDLNAVAENQVKEFRTVARIPTELSVTGRPGRLPVTAATGLYRILQEALANVLKHADASRVDVTLSFDEDEVRLSVSDDGVGVDLDGAAPGYGLENMRQRAEELGGRVEIFGENGVGTTVDVTLPVKRGEQ